MRADVEAITKVYSRVSDNGRSIRCVEFEATGTNALADALAIVGTFERATGFQGLVRSRLSLPQLLFPELREALAGGRLYIV